MNQGTVEIAPNYKFAVIAVPESRTGPTVPLVSVGDGLAVSRGLPAGALDSWRKNLGIFRMEELQKTTLFLWATTHSETPGVLDQENRDLSRRAYQLYLGLLLAVPYFSGGGLTLATGANAGNGARVRSVKTYQRTHYTAGAPMPRATVDKLKLAGRIATALQEYAPKGGDRMERALRSFRQGMEAPFVDDRLHQFVRCAEGFAVTPTRNSGKHFAERLSRLCHGRAKPYLEELYTIRGGIEHLHGPFSRLPGSLSRQAAHLRLLARTVQAEAFARFLLARYLLDPALWPVFSDKANAIEFWKLTPAKLRSRWPGKFGLANVAKDFDHEAALRDIEGNRV